MDVYSAMVSIKRLVDDCEEVIKEGKLAVTTGSVEQALKFIDLTRNISSYALNALLDARSILEMDRGNSQDKLIKYVSVYYRTALLVSLPYILTILKEVVQILSSQIHTEKASEASNLLHLFEEILGTLKS